MYPDTYIPATLFSYMPMELKVTIANMMYSTEKRLVWIDGLYLQPKERDTFFRLVIDVTHVLNVPRETPESIAEIQCESESNSSVNSETNSGTKKILQCPICSEYSIFLDRGLCPQGHFFPLTL